MFGNIKEDEILQMLTRAQEQHKADMVTIRRDSFAAAALQGLLAASVNGGFSDMVTARIAYRLADAMMKAREEK